MSQRHLEETENEAFTKTSEFTRNSQAATACCSCSTKKKPLHKVKCTKRLMDIVIVAKPRGKITTDVGELVDFCRRKHKKNMNSNGRVHSLIGTNQNTACS